MLSDINKRPVNLMYWVYRPLVTANCQFYFVVSNTNYCETIWSLIKCHNFQCSLQL